MSLTPSLLHRVKCPLDRALGASQYRCGRGTNRNSKHDHLAHSQTGVGLSYVIDHEEKTCYECSHYGIVDGDKFTYWLNFLHTNSCTFSYNHVLVFQVNIRIT